MIGVQKPWYESRLKPTQDSTQACDIFCAKCKQLYTYLCVIYIVYALSGHLKTKVSGLAGRHYHLRTCVETGQWVSR